jgi:bla regulator protein BlaR1
MKGMAVETLYRAGINNALSATILALVVACLGRLLGRRPAVLHALWLLVLLKLVTPPLYEVSVPWREPAAMDRVAPAVFEAVVLDGSTEADLELTEEGAGCSARALVPTQAEPPLLAWPAIDWMRLACVIWLSGAATMLVVSFRRIRRFQYLLKDAIPASADTQAWVDELAASIGVQGSPSIHWTEGTLPPLIWSLGRRPKMIIPVALWSGLDP